MFFCYFGLFSFAAAPFLLLDGCIYQVKGQRYSWTVVAVHGLAFRASIFVAADIPDDQVINRTENFGPEKALWITRGHSKPMGWSPDFPHISLSFTCRRMSIDSPPDRQLVAYSPPPPPSPLPPPVTSTMASIPSLSDTIIYGRKSCFIQSVPPFLPRRNIPAIFFCSK